MTLKTKGETRLLLDTEINSCDGKGLSLDIGVESAAFLKIRDLVDLLVDARLVDHLHTFCSGSPVQCVEKSGVDEDIAVSTSFGGGVLQLDSAPLAKPKKTVFALDAVKLEKLSLDRVKVKGWDWQGEALQEVDENTRLGWRIDPAGTVDLDVDPHLAERDVGQITVGVVPDGAVDVVTLDATWISGPFCDEDPFSLSRTGGDEETRCNGKLTLAVEEP